MLMGDWEVPSQDGYVVGQVRGPTSNKGFAKRIYLNNRDGQTDGTPVVKFYFALTKKNFDVTLNFNYSYNSRNWLEELDANWLR